MNVVRQAHTSTVIVTVLFNLKYTTMLSLCYVCKMAVRGETVTLRLFVESVFVNQCVLCQTT